MLRIFCNTLVAIALIHRHFGFFINWTGQQPGEGFEYHLLVIGIATVIMLRGGRRGVRRSHTL